ncbi:MAG: hypothetical protein R3E90_06590 [Marinicella sp.]
MKKVLLITALGLASANAFAGGTCDNANLAAWSGTTNPDAGALAVSAASAMAGTACGLEVSILGTRDKNFVQDTNPNGEQRYRARFYIDPNGIALPTSGANRQAKFHQAQCVAGTPPCQSNAIVQFKLQNQPTEGYVLNGFVAGDSGTVDQVRRFRVDIPDSGATAVEYDVDLSTGSFKLWVNATSEADPVATNLLTGTGVDYNDLVFTGIGGQAGWGGGVSRARLGFTNSPANAPDSQPFYLDEFESRRQTFIGQ